MVDIKAKTYEVFADKVLNEFKSSINGDIVERIVGTNPEDKFYVGKLITVNDDDAETVFTSKSFIESIGVDFYIEEADINSAKLKIYPKGDFYYRAYPSLEEQRHALLKKVNRTTNTIHADFNSVILANQTKPISTTSDLVPVYKKVRVHNNDDYYEIALNDIMDFEIGYGIVDDDHKINLDFNLILDSFQDAILNDEEYYKFKIMEEVGIKDLLNDENWANFLNTKANKQVRLLQKWQLVININVKRIKDKYLVSVSLINKSKTRLKRDKTTIETLFNSGLKIKLVDAKFDPVEMDYFLDDYKYDKMQKAIGTNCSVVYDENENMVITDHLPLFKQYKLKTNDALAVKFTELIEHPIKTLEGIYQCMLGEHKKWQEYKINKQRELTQSGREHLEREVSQFDSEIKRFLSGIEILRTHTELKRAFVLMNQAFKNSPKNYGSWRLFQIVFIVSLIPDIASCDTHLLTNDEKRASKLDMVDLLYFPTGGGKTEAFLGIMVFNMFFDRIRGKLCGTTAILRYPLRLLSVQQVQRVADVLAMAELLRKETEDIAGSGEFSLGYYVGDKNTPNKLTINLLMEIKKSNRQDKDAYKILDKCPFCQGTDIEIDVDEEQFRLVHKCNNQSCLSNGVLPLYTVDNEIYRYLPTAIISTVDKLAAIGSNSNFQNILNGATYKCPLHGYTSKNKCIEKHLCLMDVDKFETMDMYDPSPTLFIQDELHLIRESLGTYASHYESLLSYYINNLSKSKRDIKIVGATATISAYQNQVSNLYQKTSIRFPSESPFIDRNFYAYIDKKDLQRLIMGYSPFGKAVINSVVYSLKYMREIVWNYFNSPEKVLKIEGIGIDSLEEAKRVVEYYWIFLQYNNVKLDSNNVTNALEDPINTELRDDNIKHFITRKMTGDETFQDVREILAEVENSTDVFEGLNMIAATSMISHGVDADRFNVMFFYGMPGNMAEYIQAYSRAGRKYTSIIIDIMRPAREKDQSYLKNFVKFHEYKDILVESVPINRWATKAISQTLPGIFSALMINYYDTSLQYEGGNIYLMKNLKKAIVKNKINIDEVKYHLYCIYGCYVNGAFKDIGNQYKQKISDSVDSLFEKIQDRDWDHITYITAGLESLGFRVMNSLRDTDTQLILELE